MDLRLTGKAVVVLASSAGVGLAGARALSAEGAKVALSGRDPARLAQAEAELRELARSGPHSAHAQVHADAFDVRDAAALGAHLARAEQQLGPTWGLVLNAGGPPPGAAEQVDEAQLAAAYELSFLSAVRATQLALPGMRARGAGRILALTSIAVRQPVPGLAPSNALRAALTGYLKTLASEVAPAGVLVNTLCTGSFATARMEQLLAARAQARGSSLERERERALSEIPLGRMGDPDELAALACFVLSPRASFLSGAAIAIDGGATRGLY
jgi:3-oxoacyl-[acyl-carrier protein] reductase